MLLAIDVGNTNTVIGVFQQEKLVADWRVRTEPERTRDELAILIKNLFANSPLSLSSIRGVIISCVVPPVVNAFNQFCRRYLDMNPMFVGPGMKTGMPILYDNPREVGADRIVNAVAAYERHRCDLIVVDFGTATTFDCISAKGEYLGGAIAPGISISMDALFTRASKLPRVEIFNQPKAAVAKDTISAMNAGIVFGYAGLVDGLVRAINAERGLQSKVIATGGLARVIATQSETLEDIDELLTLDGLRILYQRNQ
ncbi:transcriptional activator, Baf family [Desulfarculus baarsii DSM 2075]|uniref:Type III pantothenate kinase n=1 Tax=Desulfarculus baarsii (strain ATCC 33931 / DSM 2075 / LMG 7858 / VKM B-1802 / 2st14) TaxID=644282 RepID=E1QF03_DESB2|nr:type III pantothenate kinase [Desulfarculus baarsii]ADK84139.1 transcriptional activator, Baf family [Desulfarculus baarsii DSM 2075]